MLHPKNPYIDNKNGDGNIGLILVAGSWISTAATSWFTQSNFTFLLSTTVSLMALRHYYLQGKKLKRDGK